jgi:hypothetical protein
MALISQSDAAEIIQPHARALYEIPANAWDEYHAKVPADLLVSFGPRTRASAVHDLMIQNAAKYASQANDTVLFDMRMMRGMVIKSLLAIRMKKLDEESSSRSQPTAQVTAFRNQETIDGLQALHNLELGYVLNEAETDIAEIRLVCPSGDGVYWWMRIGPTGAQPMVLPLFAAPTGPAGDNNKGPAKIGPKQKDGVVVPLRSRKDEN